MVSHKMTNAYSLWVSPPESSDSGYIATDGNPMGEFNALGSKGQLGQPFGGYRVAVVKEYTFARVQGG